MADLEQKQSLITPKDITLRDVFGKQRSYFIDIYQREYKWKDEQVKTLLNDIEARFIQHERPQTHPEQIKLDVFKRFEPYFLNTFLTHESMGNSSIVDGQQRLTTLLLILIKLYQVLKELEVDTSNNGKTFRSQKLEELILESNDFGGVTRFKIYNENREEAFRALIENRPVEGKDETQRRISENYGIVSAYYDTFLKDADKKWDLVKITYYINYLLDRISIVDIRIERQDNVAMIFEVVNDRGLGLKPYEILKGKLIGSLPEAQKEKANRVWTELQEKYFNAELKNSTERTIDLDTFFRAFFRAKFADTETEYESFENDYHYEMYRNSKIRKFFGDFNDKDKLFTCITRDIKYFAELYLDLRTKYDYEPVIFNKLLDQNQQYLLIMSSIVRDDPEKSSKIEGIARKFDQMHVILRLLDAYDSNEFQRLVYPLFPAVRGKNIAEAAPEFDNRLISALEDAGTITKGQHKTADELFLYERFSGVSNKWLNFSKYVLMRIDCLLSQLLGKPSYADASLPDLENRFNRTGSKKYGMHLEHIYAQNDKNKALFTEDEVFDESKFQRTRNLLGMVLLLKDKHNWSSGADSYKDKSDTYTKSGLVWNELLVGHLQEIEYRDLPEPLRNLKIVPGDDGVFPLASVDDRQRAIFEAIKLIWGNI